jgi:cyclophilin family peptidyl-prolyl cis-trans isomerase
MKLPRDIETYNLLLTASAKYSGKALKNKAKPEFNNPIDWQLVNRIPYHQKIQFNTTKGNFVFQLKVNEAPGTVSQIINLIRAGYFTGKYFHRVVPGFVIQAGCPRGDGFGSLMNTIRSEFSYTRYNKAGMVGMASAGNDTESSQFFVTLAPTTHLDGRYTIFGEVTSGLDVIYKIVIGDKITDASILP